MRRAVGVGARQNDDELVAAETGNGVLVAHGTPESLGDLNQQGVADPVTQRIVDILEAVQVEEHQRQRFTAAMRTRKVVPDPLLEQAAVGQTGQRIEMRQTLMLASASLCWVMSMKVPI
jgi:hypothetical protein